MPEWTFRLNEIAMVATDFWQQFGHKKVFAFYAGMGAGKTTFVHALCDVMKVTTTVGSPTFSIINEYGNGRDVIYHIDLYRLKNEEEAIRAGVEDCLYSGNISLVEWPERAPELFPDDTVHVHIKALDEQTRNMQVADK